MCSVAQSCPTLCDPMDHNLPGSSVNRIFQAKILEWVTIPPPGNLYWPRNGTHSIGRQILYHCTIISSVQFTHKRSVTDTSKPWKRDAAGPHGPRPHRVLCLPQLVGKFSQRTSLIRDGRNAETEENRQRRLTNNNIVIKHSQGPLAVSQGL